MEIAAGRCRLPTPILLGMKTLAWIGQNRADATDIEVGNHVILSFVECGRRSTNEAGRPAQWQRAFEENYLEESHSRRSRRTCADTPDICELTGELAGYSLHNWVNRLNMTIQLRTVRAIPFFGYWAGSLTSVVLSRPTKQCRLLERATTCQLGPVFVSLFEGSIVDAR